MRGPNDILDWNLTAFPGYLDILVGSTDVPLIFDGLQRNTAILRLSSLRGCVGSDVT